MNKKTILLSIAGLLIVAGLGGGLALNFWLSGLLTRESLVRQMESQWNCRADLGDLKVSLGSVPAHVELKHMVLAKRDADASAGTPLATRKPVAEGSGLVVADDLILEVDLTDLLHRRLHVKRLTVNGVHVRNSVDKEDGNALHELFSKPPSSAPSQPIPAVVASNTQPAPSPSTAAPEAPGTSSAVQPEGKTITKHPAFQADQLGMSVVVDEARLEQISFFEANHIVDTKTTISDLMLAVTNVDIDPADLEHHDQCKLDISGHVQSQGRAKVGTQMQDVKMADFTFGGNGTVQPLDPATGALAVVGAVEVELKKGSTFGGTQTIGELAEGDKGFKNMKSNFGIDVADVKVGGQLQADMKTLVAVNGPLVKFAKDAVFPFPDYTVTLREASWLDGAENKQEMQLLLLPSDALAKTLLDGVKVKLGDGLVKVAQEMFNDGQGHLAFELVSKGTLSKPKMELGGQAGELQKAFKGLFKGLLK